MAITSGVGRRMLVISAVLVMGAAGSAGASGIAQIIHARQNHFRTLGRTAKSIRDQAGRSHPNWAVVEADADRVERLASALPSWFPAGSGQGHGVRTRARPAIWAEPRQFARFARRLLHRAQQLRQAAASHDVRALRLRARSLGRGCDSCHRRFRAHRSWWHLW